MCNCISEANKVLRKHNTTIVMHTAITVKGKVRRALPIPTKKIDSRKRGPVLRLQSAFCPMCGEQWASAKPEGQP